MTARPPVGTTSPPVPRRKALQTTPPRTAANPRTAADPRPEESSANGAEAGTQTELEAFWTRARNVAGIAPLEAVLGQDDAASLRPPAFAFGDGPEMSDRLAKLVLDGEKSATSAWLASYEAEGIDIPEVGDLSIMCDGADRPLALLRTADVRKIPFADVGPEIAQAEGEGTLDEWKAEHRDFFARECAALGIEFDPEGEVVVEFFEVVYRRDGA